MKGEELTGGGGRQEGNVDPEEGSQSEDTMQNGAVQVWVNTSEEQREESVKDLNRCRLVLIGPHGSRRLCFSFSSFE